MLSRGCYTLVGLGALLVFNTGCPELGEIDGSNDPKLGFNFDELSEPDPLELDADTMLEGVITDDFRLIAGRDYFLKGPVFIGSDMGPDPENPFGEGFSTRLIIDPGVKIYALTPESRLIVNRGSQIIAEGTRENPITFLPFRLPNHELDQMSRNGEWGGLVINGRAPLGGLDEFDRGDGSGLFGGSAPTDCSGALRFVRVLFAGYRAFGDPELNGIAFQGVGSQTQINSVQVHNSQDDGIEFFGGTANARNLVVTGAGDDGIDWTQGWSGKIQHALVMHNPFHPNAGGNGLDGTNTWDGFEGEDVDTTPRSSPILSNFTIVGTGSESEGHGVHLRRGTAGQFYNFRISNFRKTNLRISDQPTLLQIQLDLLRIQSILVSNQSPIDPLSEAEEDGLLDGEEVNAFEYYDLPETVWGGVSVENGEAGSEVQAVDLSTVDMFFESTIYVGAFPDSDTNFTTGWTIWLDTPIERRFNKLEDFLEERAEAEEQGMFREEADGLEDGDEISGFDLEMGI